MFFRELGALQKGAGAFARRPGRSAGSLQDEYTALDRRSVMTSAEKLVSMVVFVGLWTLMEVCAAENLALGKKVFGNGVALRGGDYAVLTDGKKAVEKPGLEYRDAPETLMVMTGSSVEGWEITIDLGEVYGIDRIVFPAPAHYGIGGVATPMAVNAFMSDDGESYRSYGNIAEDCVFDIPDCFANPPAYRADFKSRPLNGHGRFIKLLARSFLYYYCDEIEVFGTKTPGRDDGTPVTRFGMGWDTLTQSGMKRRMAADWRCTVAAIKNLPADKQTIFMKEANDLRQRILDFKFEGDVLAGHLLSAPYNDIHRAIYALFGKTAHASGLDEIVVTIPAEYDYQRQFVKPVGSAGSIVRKMMRNEERGAVIALFNASGDAKKVSFSFPGLPVGAVTPMRVEYSDTFAMVPVASALQELRGENGVYELDLPAGMNTQLWLQISARALDAGSHEGWVVFSGALNGRLPLALEVAPLALPETLAHEGTMWDYSCSLEYGLTKDNVKAARELMNRFQISPCGYGRFPEKAYSEDISVSFSELDQMRKAFPDAKRYHLFFCLNSSPLFAGLAPGSGEFGAAVADWAAKFRKGLKERDLSSDRVVMQLFDEPNSAEQFQTLAYWAEAVMAGMPDARIVWNPSALNDALLEDAEKALRHCRYMMPRATAYLAASPAWHELCRKYIAKGHLFSLYDCGGPNRIADPDYFRLPAWVVAKEQGVGTSYWSLASGCSWNDYLVRCEANVPWATIYLGKEDVQPSKQLFAWMESRYDFAYLTMLKSQIEALKKQGKDVAESQEAMDRAYRTIDNARLARPNGKLYYSQAWIENKTINTLMNQVREELLPVLVKNADTLKTGR